MIEPMRFALQLALGSLLALSTGAQGGVAPSATRSVAEPVAARASAENAPASASPTAGSSQATRSSQAVPTPATRMIRLRDGSLLWASIESHSAEGLQLLRVDTGGRVELEWNRLDPTQARALQIDYGYLDPNGDEVLVTADRLPLVDGRDIVGLIVNHAEDALHLKTAQSLLQIPLARIAGPATQVQVPALDIYTREELYQQKQVELAPRIALGGAAAAEGAFELARFCEKILDYAHAVQHYAEAAQLDPSYKPADVAAARTRAGTKAALQEQVDALAAIDLERKKGNFDKGVALSTAFSERWPESPLLPEWKKALDRLTKARDAFLKQQTVQLWHRETERLARAAAAKYSFAQCVEYAGGLLAQETLDAVTQALQKSAKGIEPGTVRALWDAREKRGTHRASYGLGTWMLGEERARKDLDKKKAESKPQLPKAQSSEQAKVAEALKRYLQNQEVARKAAGGGATDSEDAEAFWREQLIGTRVQWMLAYHAEYSGNMQVVAVQGENCPECGGKGAREVASGGVGASTPGNRDGPQSGSNAGSRLAPCATCKHTGVIRRVVYR
jgi:hypothetical protein